MIRTGKVMLAVALALAAGASVAPAQDRWTVCLASPYDAGTGEGDPAIRALVHWLRPVVASYPGLASVLEEARPDICLTTLATGAEGYYLVDDNRIVLRRGLSQTMMRAVALHELRHVEQYQSGNCPGPGLSMRETARVTFAIEADASVTSLVVAWDQREAGAPQVWHALAGWPSQADIAEAFRSEVAASGDVAKAAARAFAQWYQSGERRRKYYVAACSDYLDRQDRSNSLSAYGTAPLDYLTSLCRLPDGRRYACKEPEDALP